MEDDDDLRSRQSTVKPPDLSGWSVAELEAYIARLEVEKARAHTEIEKKNAVRNAAEALFKKS